MCGEGAGLGRRRMGTLGQALTRARACARAHTHTADWNTGTGTLRAAGQRRRVSGCMLAAELHVGRRWSRTPRYARAAQPAALRVKACVDPVRARVDRRPSPHRPTAPTAATLAPSCTRRAFAPQARTRGSGTARYLRVDGAAAPRRLPAPRRIPTAAGGPPQMRGVASLRGSRRRRTRRADA
jgi:hypothetical protein